MAKIQDTLRAPGPLRNLLLLAAVTLFFVVAAAVVLATQREATSGKGLKTIEQHLNDQVPAVEQYK